MQDVKDFFRDTFEQEPDGIGFAPGRVNLIGEHTDYNDGFVFPAAIQLGIRIAVKKVDQEISTLVSLEAGKGSQFNAATVMPNQVEGWVKYPAGVAWAFRQKYCVVPPNLIATVVSDLPMGASLSSSAAIELAFATAWNDILCLNLTKKELALLSQYAENQFVGVNSGVMDQLASAMGEKGKALFIDTRSLEIRTESLPKETELVVCDTKTSRELAHSAYNERRAQCEEVAKKMGIKALRDASIEMLNEIRPELTDTLYRRAHHIISENNRCERFLLALKGNDLNEIGRLMKASHESLRDDYEVSSFALDQMADAAWRSPQCVGARMTGAGFGGACIAICHSKGVDEFINSTAIEFKQSVGHEGEFITSLASGGAHYQKIYV